MRTKDKKVYVGMCADVIHKGHINITEKAKEHGIVIVGLLSDEAIASYKRLPFKNWEERKLILERNKDVDIVIKQRTLDYVENLKDIKPDYVIHGDDWKHGVQKQIRERVIQTISKWGGRLIEVPYTKGVSSTQLIEKINNVGTTPNQRLSALRTLIEKKPIVRICEAHNGLSGLVVEKAKYKNTETGETKSFDGFWESSLTDSTSKGKPDTGCVDITSRTKTVEEIFEVTTKPMIFDGDNGGFPEHFCFMVRTLERLGVSAVIIEDKIGFKRNSLFGTSVKQTQANPNEFAEKITMGKRSQITEDFMIIARIESLILKQGVDDAIKRAKIYAEAGADGIMIHSKDKTPDQIIEFCEKYKKEKIGLPLVVVPSTYSKITEKQLIKLGVKVVIYANHLLRSAYPSMVETAQSILKNNRCEEASKKKCMPIKEIINLIPEV